MYEFLASQLLENGAYSHLTNSNGDFGFSLRPNYTGLMAQASRTGKNRGRVVREKQGLFDIYITTGELYGSSGVSHRNVLESVTNFTTLEKCFEVWRGNDPVNISSNQQEAEFLTTLMLMFFEQEINWGKESWQRYTYFSPKVRTPKRIRPRDMLMGYICQTFDLGVDNIAFWMTSRPTTTTFIAPDRSNYGFEDYPTNYKEYFTNLMDDDFAEALMTGEVLKVFRSVAQSQPNNPYFK